MFYYIFFSLVDATYPGIQLPLLESIRCHSTDEYLIYGIEEEVCIGPDKEILFAQNFNYFLTH